MDVQIYLQPISDADPVGKSVRYEQDYYDLEEAQAGGRRHPEQQTLARESETQGRGPDHQAGDAGTCSRRASTCTTSAGDV